MENRKCFYLVEGECEEKLLKALKEQPALINPGSVKKFNVIQNEIPASKLMSFDPGSRVVLVFDTDKEVTEHLKKNIEMLNKVCSKVEVLTIAQVLNFEDEIVKSTDVSKAQDLTRSRSVSNFKSDFCRMKVQECRSLLERHQFDVEKIWVSDPPSAFKDLEQGATRIISVTTK